jgi:hypothetical protein
LQLVHNIAPPLLDQFQRRSQNEDKVHNEITHRRDTGQLTFCNTSLTLQDRSQHQVHIGGKTPNCFVLLNDPDWLLIGIVPTNVPCDTSSKFQTKTKMVQSIGITVMSRALVIICGERRVWMHT